MAAKLTNKQKRDYVERTSHKCPYCGSESIQGEECEFLGDEINKRIMCLDCGAQWYDVFKLADVEEIDNDNAST